MLQRPRGRLVQTGASAAPPSPHRVWAIPPDPHGHGAHLVPTVHVLLSRPVPTPATFRYLPWHRPSDRALIVPEKLILSTKMRAVPTKVLRHTSSAQFASQTIVFSVGLNLHRVGGDPMCSRPQLCARPKVPIFRNIYADSLRLSSAAPIAPAHSTGRMRTLSLRAEQSFCPSMEKALPSLARRLRLAEIQEQSTSLFNP